MNSDEPTDFAMTADMEFAPGNESLPFGRASLLVLRPTEPTVRFGYTASEIANLSLLKWGLSGRPVAVLR